MGTEKNKKKSAFLSGSSVKMSPENKRIFHYIFFVILLIILLCIGVWRFFVTPANDVRFEKEKVALLKKQQEALSGFKTAFTEELSKHAHSEQALLLASQLKTQNTNNTESDFLALQQDILNSLPHAKKVKIYQPRQAQEEKNNGGNIGFVELSMINQAEKNTLTYPEVSKAKDSEEWEIHWVQAIYKEPENKSQDLPTAILYVSTSLTGLEKAMAGYDQRLAQFQLRQSIGRQRQLHFLTVGNGNSYGSKSIDVPSSHWQIEIKPSTALYKKASHTPLWLLLLIASISGAALWGAYTIAQRKNAQQAALYQTLDIATETANSPPATNEEKAEQGELDDPLYLSDQHIVIDDADAALVDGSHQDKKHDSGVKENAAISQTQATGPGLAVPTHIFRAYDIRGVVEEELTPAIAEAVGKAVATEALEQGETAIIIGHDARTHSPMLCEHLKQGVLSTGCNVIFAGLVPTPLLNFAAIFSDQSSSGIIVTASHNPKNYNGFKIVINERTLVDDDIQRLQERITQGVLTQGDTGEVSEEDFTEDYIDTVLADIAINSGLRIVIDAANGAASEIAPKLFEELGCEVIPLFCSFDGEFPNHDPDPSIKQNLQPLIEKVKAENADIGIALDGDGDRLVVITQSGNIIWPDQLLMLFARDVVSRNPGCDVIFDIKSTRQLNQVISSYGGRPVMWKTGHSHIKAKMRETEALLAGEYSGHIFFKERWFGFDDGVYAAARLLEIMSLRDQSLDDMLSAMPIMTATPEIKIPVSEETKFTIVKQLIEQGDFAAGEKTTIDGLRVDFDKGWGLIRASNTAPALTLRFEAQNENGIEQLKTLFKRELSKVDQSLPLDF